MSVQLLFWHWWVLTLVFTVIEAMVPSGVFAAMSIAGAVTGGVGWAYDIKWTLQLLLFSTVTVVVYLPLSMVLKKWLAKQGELDKFSPQQYIGQEFTLTSPIVNGFTEQEIDGVIHSMKGPTLRASTQVKVIGTDGNMLVVHPIHIDKDPTLL